MVESQENGLSNSGVGLNFFPQVNKSSKDTPCAFRKRSKNTWRMHPG